MLMIMIKNKNAYNLLQNKNKDRLYIIIFPRSSIFNIIPNPKILELKNVHYSMLKFSQTETSCETHV